MGKVKKVLKWVGIVVLGLFFIVYVVRIFYFVNLRKTEAAVAKIHATKLTLPDVMGTNLPPDPGEAADDTIEGVDANKNGIRDDVELAIFEKYPNSAKTRAVLLQYALALQMEMTQEIVNTGTVIAVAQETSRASRCIGDVTPRSDMDRFIQITQELTEFVRGLHINTDQRDEAEQNFYKKIDSYSDISTQCDIDLSILQN